MLGIPVVAVSDDTEIYSISPIDVNPNVLIIFDNSGSMSNKDIPGATYENTVAYSGSYTKDVVYRPSNSYFPDIIDPNWQCQAAKDKLQDVGYWQGKLSKFGGVVTCSSRESLEDYELGNYRNFKAANLGDDRIRMVVAKEVIAKLIAENIDTIKFGLMKFYDKEGGYIVSPCAKNNSEALIGKFDLASPPTFIDDDQSEDYGAVGGMVAQTMTPLAETTAEAGLYFAGANPRWFSEDHYTSPIEYSCQKNYIILITDGAPTMDDNVKLADEPYLNGKKIPADGQDGVPSYLDDVTYFLKNNDLRSDLGIEEEGSKDQTVTTYVIGFKQDLQLLKDAAKNGGGIYYTADNAATLNEAVNSVITSINENNENFSTAAVPMSRANKAYAGGQVYYSLFQPLNTGAWIGNIKKYSLTNEGELQDQTGASIIVDGKISEHAHSFWSLVADGIKVNKGGAGEKLEVDIKDGKVRNIYTYTGTNTTLTDSTNEFVKDNDLLNDIDYNQLTDSVIDTVRREDGSFPLGDFLHTQPLVAHYDTTANGTYDTSVVLAGSNDGMLHAFDDADGSELWAYIPSDLLGNLYQLQDDNTHSYFVDGASLLYSYDHDSDSITADQQLFIFGERRGGYNYSVLNITDHTSPKLQYEIGLNILGVGNETLGQSWSKPQIVSMGYLDHGGSYLTKEVFFLSGGYDENQDSLLTDAPPIDPTDSVGRGVFAVDIETGDVLNNDATITNGSFAKMTHSIVAARAFENPKSRIATRIYAGDMNGNVFAFRDDVYHYNRSEKSAHMHGNMFDGIENGDWSQKLLLHDAPGKKIFYPPNIVNEYFVVGIDYEDGNGDKPEKRVGDYVFYGTGDRAHPKRTDIENAFYAIKNSWQWEKPVDAELVEAYVDIHDFGIIKAIDDDRILVDKQRDDHGLLVDLSGAVIDVHGNGEKFIIDVTDDLVQNQDADLIKRTLISNYAKDAIYHPANRGWFLRFDEDAGEKIVSSPIIFNGVIYFSTYVPEAEVVSSDPCSISLGTGYLWAIDYKLGGAVEPTFDETDNPPSGEDNPPTKADRKRELTQKGIPPGPVVVIQENGAIVMTGLDSLRPTAPPNMLRRYWRHM